MQRCLGWAGTGEEAEAAAGHGRREQEIATSRSRQVLEQTCYAGVCDPEGDADSCHTAAPDTFPVKRPIAGLVEMLDGESTAGKRVRTRESR